MRRILYILSILMLSAAAASAQASLAVNPDVELGPVRKLNGVGGGPQGIVTPELYKAAGIPYARYHDLSINTKHTVDIFQIFPDFEADENDPASYDFVMTDEYVQRTLSTGAEIIWRLGNSHHEPNQIKKYGAWPPKDFAKWARICEHVVRHYNDGWADGFHFGIDMWEIWNEPDGDQRPLSASENVPESEKDKVGKAKRCEVAPHSWGGTMEQYYEFYSTVFKYLKKTHPEIRVGGPANAGFWANEPFIQAMIKEGVKVDFYTWHRYSRNPETLSEEGVKVRELLDSYGWNDVPTNLDEWNYVTGWTPADTEYSTAVRGSVKGTAYTAACMCHMQDAGCTDMMSYNDWRTGSIYNGAFDKQNRCELPTYYVFYNWNLLRQYGTQVKVDCDEKDVYAVAAKNPEGSLRLLVSRFNDDDAVRDHKTVLVTVPQGCDTPVCYLSDSGHKNCEYPFEVIPGKGLRLDLEPNAMVFIEF